MIAVVITIWCRYRPYIVIAVAITIHTVITDRYIYSKALFPNGEWRQFLLLICGEDSQAQPSWLGFELVRE